MAAGSSTPRRLRALVAVARAYRLAPREIAAGLWFARCPGCPRGARGRSLVLRETPTGARFECRLCGVHGARLNGLQRIAEGAANDDKPAPAVADLRTTLRVAVARFGADALSDALDRSTNPVAMAAADELAEVEKLEPGPDGATRHGPRGVPGLRIVQAANDDTPPAPDPELCRCPACEGRDDRGEGDA